MKFLGLNITRSAKPKPTGESVVTVKRSFDAARTDRLFSDWTTDAGYTAAEARDQLWRVRGRMRDMAKNNPFARKWLWMLKSNIVGDLGFVLSARSGELVPGSGYAAPEFRLDEKANDEIERGWHEWASNPQWVDMSGRKTFKAICDLALTQWQRDGEAIIRIVDGNTKHGNPYKFGLKMYQPEALDADYLVDDTGRGTSIVNGVEIDSWGEPVRYWFKQRSTSQLSNDPYGSLAGKRVSLPAKDIIHLFSHEDEQQNRGWPGMASCLDRMKMLDGYDEAESVAARDAANSVGTYARDPNTVTDETQIATPSAVAQSVQDAEPGLRQVLPPGWGFEENNPMRPNPAYSEYHKAALRGIASGALVSYNMLAEDLESVSWSSLREGKLSTTDMYKLSQVTMIEQMVSRIFQRWLLMFLSFGPTSLPLDKYPKFKRHLFFAKRWQWVNPSQEGAFNEKARNYGWKTDQTIAAELGQEYTDNVMAIKTTGPKVAGTYLEANYAKAETNPT
jgi:lambda family phage portal protein